MFPNVIDMKVNVTYLSSDQGSIAGGDRKGRVCVDVLFEDWTKL